MIWQLPPHQPTRQISASVLHSRMKLREAAGFAQGHTGGATALGFGPGLLQLRHPCFPCSLLPQGTQGFSQPKLPRSQAELSVASDSHLSLSHWWEPGFRGPLYCISQRRSHPRHGPRMTLQVKGHVPQTPPPPDSPWMPSVPHPPPCQRGEMPSYRRAWLQPRLITGRRGEVVPWRAGRADEPNDQTD